MSKVREMGKNDDIRAVLLGVIERNRPRDRTTNLQSTTILREASIALGIRNDHAMEEALLTQFHASLLIFPELLRLAHALRAWVINNMS